MLNFKDLIIQPVPVKVAEQLISRNHYSRVMPALTRICYGGFIDTQLVAVVTLGWGTRPLHTIKKLFPSLGVQDYFELGKMCLVNELPKNSESYFLSRILERLRIEYPDKKLLFTWADGIVGKPGYVYQAANFLYGGYIWTDSYFTPQGEKIHPRQSKKIMQLAPDESRKARPSDAQLKHAEVLHYKGKQFRYIYFTCDKKTKKQLLNESTVKWTLAYPKQNDLAWKVKNAEGIWVESPIPVFSNSKYRFSTQVPVAQAVQGLLL